MNNTPASNLPGKDISPSLLEHITGFTRALQDAGVSVNASSLIHFCNCFDHIDIADKADFYNAARTTLVSSRDELPRFKQVFLEYWFSIKLPKGKDPGDESELSEDLTEGENKNKSTSESSEESNTDEQADQKVPEQAQTGASKNEALLTKDLSQLDPSQLEEVNALIRQIAETLLIRNSHRTKSSYVGKDLDQRKMLRDAARCDGHILKLRYRQQKFRKAKLFLLCDVSGSMDRYASFLIQFIHIIQDRIPGFEVALFSTRMSIVTRFVKQKDIRQALPLLANHVHDWSGGTQIGVSLRQFNHHFSREMSQNRSVVMILSDGWDRGDARLMRNELQNLRRRVHRLIWLNPLLGNKEYRPLARGMRTAIPYLDEFLPFNDINSLKNVVRALKASFSA